MNHNVTEENNFEQEPTISIELDPSCSDGGAIELPLSTFNNLLDQEVTKFIMKTDTDVDIIDLNELRANVQQWKSKYESLDRQAKMLECVLQRLKRDLEINKHAQPMRCMAGSVSQFVNISVPWANMRKKSKNIPEIVMSDSDDDVIITMSKSQTKNEDIIIDLIDSDDDTQNSMVKYKPGPKSKTNVSILDHQINDNDTILPINTEVSTSCNGKCSSITKRKRKPGPKSKTMFVDDIVPENKETVVKKMRLNKCDVINKKAPNSKKVLNCKSVKKSKGPEKNDQKILNVSKKKANKSR